MHHTITTAQKTLKCEKAGGFCYIYDHGTRKENNTDHRTQTEPQVPRGQGDRAHQDDEGWHDRSEIQG